MRFGQSGAPRTGTRLPYFPVLQSFCVGAAAVVAGPFPIQSPTLGAPPRPHDALPVGIAMGPGGAEDRRSSYGAMPDAAVPGGATLSSRHENAMGMASLNVQGMCRAVRGAAAVLKRPGGRGLCFNVGEAAGSMGMAAHRRRRGGWHKASVSDCLPLAAPIGLSPLLILTLCGPERVLVVSTDPPDDLSCLTTPGVGRPGDGLLPVPWTRCIQMHTPRKGGNHLRAPTPPPARPK